MGIIEDRLAELEALEPPRTDHRWRGARGGDLECAVCGCWMAGYRNPEKYLPGCPGAPAEQVPRSAGVTGTQPAKE